MSLKLKKREKNKVPKFKVGDRVKIINQEYIRPYIGIKIGFLGTVINVPMNDGYDVKFDNYGSSLFFVEKNLELVEPEKEETKYFKYYVRGLPREIPLKLSDLPYLTDEKGFIKYPKIEPIGRRLPSRHISFEKPFPYFHFSLDDDALDAIKYSYGKELDKMFFFGRGKDIKNLIPDRVIFNKEKGKTTILFSLHDNGLPPYAPFTSKTVGSDKFDKSMGFLIAYYKYINREMKEDRLREQIELIFDYNKNDRTMYLSGAIEQALLPHYTKERIFEVFEAILKCEGTFDLLKYEEIKLKEQRKKEALRKKNINKQIKKREIEIKGLKEKL